MIRNWMKRLVHDSRGATAIEYGLIASLIVILLIGGISAVGIETGNHFNNVNNGFSDG